ncbi:hypothetical protein Tco_0446230 [Tanacetum coccineum]
MSTLAPRRYHWEIVYPSRPRRYIDPVTGFRMKRTAYRRRVLVPTQPSQVKEKSPENVPKVKLKEDLEKEEERRRRQKVVQTLCLWTTQHPMRRLTQILSLLLRAELRLKSWRTPCLLLCVVLYVDIKKCGHGREYTEMALTRLSNRNNNDENPNNNGGNPNITAIIAQQLQGIIPHIVTQVTNNVNNANENGGNTNGGNNNGCTYNEFLVCKPRDFDRKGGAIVLTRWIENMESVMDISGCVNNQKVRFHELAKLVPHLVTPESKRIDRYIYGLVPQIYRMIQATQPNIIQSVILKAETLTDEAVRCGTLSKSSEKRKKVKEPSKQKGS